MPRELRDPIDTNPCGRVGRERGRDRVVQRDALVGEQRPSPGRPEGVPHLEEREVGQLQTLSTVTKLSAGGRPGAESSLTKVFWSELDVQLHETALGLLRADTFLSKPTLIWSDDWLSIRFLRGCGAVAQLCAGAVDFLACSAG